MERTFATPSNAPDPRATRGALSASAPIGTDWDLGSRCPTFRPTILALAATAASAAASAGALGAVALSCALGGRISRHGRAARERLELLLVRDDGSSLGPVVMRMMGAGECQMREVTSPLFEQVVELLFELL